MDAKNALNVSLIKLKSTQRQLKFLYSQCNDTRLIDNREAVHPINEFLVKVSELEIYVMC